MQDPAEVARGTLAVVVESAEIQAVADIRLVPVVRDVEGTAHILLHNRRLAAEALVRILVPLR